MFANVLVQVHFFYYSKIIILSTCGTCVYRVTMVTLYKNWESEAEHVWKIKPKANMDVVKRIKRI